MNCRNCGHDIPIEPLAGSVVRGGGMPAVWHACPLCRNTGRTTVHAGGMAFPGVECPLCRGHRVIGVADGRAPGGEP